MKKGFYIAAGIILAVAAFLKFALVGYSFLAYCLACAAGVVLIYGFLIRRKCRKTGCLRCFSCKKGPAPTAPVLLNIIFFVESRISLPAS